MENFEDIRWVELIKSFRQRVEEDKKYFNCWSTYVKLPEICPQPKFCLIGMEPGPGKNHEEPEYRNFLANKEDFIVQYSAFHYLGDEGFNYQMTDMAKGGIEINDAGRTQEERYDIWLPLLRKELKLLGDPKVIFIGKRIYEEWGNKFSSCEFIPHHSGAARGYVKNYYDSIPNIVNYDPPEGVKIKIRELAADLMDRHKYKTKLRDEILRDAFSNELTDADKRLLAVYRYDFERFSKYITIPLINSNLDNIDPHAIQAEKSSKTNGAKGRKPGATPIPPAPSLDELSLDEATKAVKEGVDQSGIVKEIHDIRDNPDPNIKSKTVGFKTKRMEKYLPQNNRQTYNYWVGLMRIRDVYLIRCWLTFSPRNQSKDIVEKINKILSLFDRGTVNNERNFIDIIRNRDIDDNNPTPSAITKAVKDVLADINERIDKYFNDIGIE